MPNVLLANLPYLLRGALITLALSFVVVVLGSLLGVVIGVIAASSSRLLRLLTTAYIVVLRGISDINYPDAIKKGDFARSPHASSRRA